MNKEIQHGIRISQILARLNWMDNNLSGCDWCCGGGDEESASLNEEFQKLTGMKTWEYRKEVREFEGSWISKRDFIESNPNCDLLGLTNEVFYDIILRGDYSSPLIWLFKSKIEEFIEEDNYRRFYE